MGYFRKLIFGEYVVSLRVLVSVSYLCVTLPVEHYTLLSYDALESWEYIETSGDTCDLSNWPADCNEFPLNLGE